MKGNKCQVCFKYEWVLLFLFSTVITLEIVVKETQYIAKNIF